MYHNTLFNVECGISCTATPFKMAPPMILWDVDFGYMSVNWYQLLHPSETGTIIFLHTKTNHFTHFHLKVA